MKKDKIVSPCIDVHNVNDSHHLNPMRYAVQLALENIQSGQGGPFGCVIVDQDNRIIGRGTNSVVRLHDPTSHAEIVAVREACQTRQSWNLEGCTAFSSCEPCPMCYSALRWAYIRRIYYVSTRNDAHNIGFRDEMLYDSFKEKTLPFTSQIHHDDNLVREARTVFDLWSKKSTTDQHY